MPFSILIVEDSSAMRAFVISALEEIQDFKFFETGSGFEAIKLLPRQKIDLIVTDINMPDINGLELVGFVKKNPSYKSIPMVVITTEKSAQDRKRAIELGADEYLVKPFEPHDLREKVKKHLKLGT